VAAPARLLPSAAGWHHEDDIRNLRWALEYRDAPWRALTELHSVHAHIRPLTNLAVWAGATLSDGAFAGPQMVHMALCALALAGGVALAWQITGRWTAGLLAGALAVALPGFGEIPWWTAWMCSAGEIACGLWGLVAALRSGRALWLAAPLLACAGLFKEPGWVIYPGVCAVLWLGAPRGRARWALGLPVVLGALGLAMTWHPLNVTRTAPAEMLAVFAAQGGALIDRWPLEEQALSGVGIPALAVGMMLGLALSRRAPLVLGGVLGAIFLALPDAPGGVALIFACAAAALRSGSHRIGLLVVTLAFGVMASYPHANAVQVLAGGLGLAVATGAALTDPRLVSGRWWVAVAAAILALSPLARLTVRDAGLAGGAVSASDLVSRDAFLGVGALARELGAREVSAQERLGPLILAPLLGLEPTDVGGEIALSDQEIALSGPEISLPDGVRLRRPRDWPAEMGRLDGVLLPLKRKRDTRPRPGRSRKERFTPAHVETLAAGFYALGLKAGELHGLLADGVTLLEAWDNCGRRWAVRGAGRSAAAVVLRVTPECAELSMTRAIDALPGTPFLLPLPEPEISLRRARISRRLLDVRVTTEADLPPPSTPHAATPQAGGSGRPDATHRPRPSAPAQRRRSPTPEPDPTSGNPPRDGDRPPGGTSDPPAR